MDIKDLAIQKAVATLNAVGAKYKIILSDGMEIGELQVAPLKPVKGEKRKGQKYGWGKVSEYIDPFLAKVEVGGQIKIPIGPLDKDTLRAGVTSRAGQKWGNGSYVTQSYGDPYEGVEILRIG